MNMIPDKTNLSDTEDDCVLESVTYMDYKCRDKQNNHCIYKENTLLAEFIEKCYDVENTKGMFKVINEHLLKNYKESNHAFKTSADFEKVLKRSIILLERKPNYIFSQIQHLCKVLRLGSINLIKRIKPITLSTSLKDNSNKNILKRKSLSADECKLQTISAVDTDKVDLTEESNPINNNIEAVNQGNLTNSRKNKRTESESLSGTEDNKLLVPTKILEINVNPDTLFEEKIRKIEKEISRCKSVIAKLDELEVDDDSVNSPYIKSEKLKTKIVFLYGELCKLTGNSTVKKRMIHLRVIEGHPVGPVRCLEKFLNDNIGSDGDPPFPDFSDVIDCVSQANEKDNLGWTRNQILKEARALFTQCGRALQKRRQNREWQDLLHKVKPENCNSDPADSDPALLQRLEENRRAALKKESQILERFTLMQTAPSHAHDLIRCDDVASCSDMDMSGDVSHNFSQDNLQETLESEEAGNVIDKENKEDTIQCEANYNEIKIKKEPEEEIEDRLSELGNGYTLTVREIEDDSFLTIEISDSSDDEGS